MSAFGKVRRTLTEMKCVDAIAVRSEAKMRTVTVAKYRHFWFLITDHSAVLYYASKRMASFIFPQGLASADLLQGVDGSLTLYGIIEDQVVSFNITSWVKSLRQKEKKTKKKMKETDDADQSSSKRRKKEHPEASNDAIFQSLLPSSQQPVEPEEAADIQKGLESLFQMDVIYLEEKKILFKGDNLVDCLVLDDLIITLSHHLGGYVVSTSACFDRMPCSKLSESASSSQELFSYLLTREAVPVTAESQKHCGLLSGEMFETKRKGKTNASLTATKLVPASQDRIVSTNSQPICHEIFAHMFGTDSTFLECEAILVGTLDGKILSSVLKGSSTRSSGSELRNSSQLYSIVYDLQQPVVLVTTMKFEGVMGSDIPGNNSLLFVGRRGKICLMVIKEASQVDTNIKTRFEERSVKGPVLSPVHLDGNCLFYSTGTELVSVKLEFVERHDGTSKQRDLQVTSSEYPVKNVSCLTRQRMELSSEDNTQLETFMTYSTSGKLNSVTIGETDKVQSATVMTSAQAGQKMKELMLSIHDSTKKINDYQKVSKLQNTILSELTKAGHLARLLLGTRKHQEPFFVEVRLILQDNGSQKVQIVECKMTNRTKWTFGCEWSVCASICSKQHGNRGPQVEQAGRGHKSCFSSKPATFTSYKLDNLKPDMFTVFHFTVHDGSQWIPAPYEVKVYLHFTSSFVDQLPGFLEDNNDEATGFMLPVCSKRVDILHMLRPVYNVTTKNFGTNVVVHQDRILKSAQSGTIAMDTKFREDRDWLENTLKKLSEEMMMMKPKCDVNRKDQDVLRTTTLLVNATTLASLNLQGLTFMQWLFKDNHHISSVCELESSDSSLQAVSPTGTSVQIIQSPHDEDVSKTKIQVYSTSCQLLAEVWEAIHFRLANSLENMDIMNQPMTKSKEEQAKLIRSVQTIENSLGELRDQLPSKLDEHQKVICGIYEEMRKLTLRL